MLLSNYIKSLKELLDKEGDIEVFEEVEDLDGFPVIDFYYIPLEKDNSFLLLDLTASSNRWYLMHSEDYKNKRKFTKALIV